MTKTSKSIFDLPQFLRRKGAIECFIFMLVFVIYANTLQHDFTQDDAIVIYDNIYVKDGLKGIRKIFTTDSFSGFFKGEDKSSLVSGGRYRPMTIATFALIYQFVGSAPFIYHLFNVFMYAILCVVLFKTLSYAHINWSGKKLRFFAFVAAVIFAIHPVHTEVVANTKGLDEVFSLLFSLLALLLAMRITRKPQLTNALLLVLVYFVALLSKENAVAFVLIIPVVLYFFTKPETIYRRLLPSAIILLTFIGYWILRIQIVGADLGSTPSEMMNNPFIKVVDGSYLPFTSGEKWASILLGMGKYIQLLFFPHPLTHDYYPRHFGVVTFRDVTVWAAIIMNLSLILIALMGVKKRSFITFCIFLFYVSIGLMSNIIFPIGTHLSERFLFTPSIAFALVCSLGIIQLRRNERSRQFSVLLFSVLVILGSLKTIIRNNAWKDDLTLFLTDVETSKKSAKVRNAAGGALLTASLQAPDGEKKELMIRTAIDHLNEAIKIHPRYKEAYLLSGNAYSYIKDYESSIRSYDMALKIYPYYEQASSNLLIVLREGAREAGAVNGDFASAIKYLKRALSMEPNDFESVSMMGTAYGSAGDHKKAIEYFEQAIGINPNVAATYINLGYAQLNIGLDEDAQISFNKAVQIDPKALERIQKQK